MMLSHVRLTIYINEYDRWNGLPLYHAIILRAKELGLAGATVVRAVEGYGSSYKVYSLRFVDFALNLPMVIHIIDTDIQINMFLPHIERMIKGNGLITIENIELIDGNNQIKKETVPDKEIPSEKPLNDESDYEEEHLTSNEN